MRGCSLPACLRRLHTQQVVITLTGVTSDEWVRHSTWVAHNSDDQWWEGHIGSKRYDYFAALDQAMITEHSHNPT